MSLADEKLIADIKKIGGYQLPVTDAQVRKFMEEFCKTVCIPGRIGGQLRGILALQPSLHRMPPRRPASLVGRPDFADAMSYLCLIAKTRAESRTAREWWEAFLETPSASDSAPPIDEAPAKRRRKRRRRRPAPADAG